MVPGGEPCCVVVHASQVLFGTWQANFVCFETGICVTKARSQLCIVVKASVLPSSILRYSRWGGGGVTSVALSIFSLTP